MAETIVLKTDLGQLRGQTHTSIEFNKTYYAFRGIPYGKPPIGDLRFKAPQPYGGWEGVRDALKGRDCSKQPSLIQTLSDPKTLLLGNEDCLYLNVYINELPETSTAKKPVMFSIHGGGFVGGSGEFNYYGPDYNMNEDIVLVTFNYRCGSFGFLSLENEEVPGNAGLKDQTLALQWVKDNIHSFGGDPNNVTIFGISAGGASVHYQLLSQTSKGLFHKAIIQSGFANNAWTFQPEPRKTAVRLAKTLGCSSDNDSEILQFLQSVPADDIVVATKNITLDLSERIESFTFIFTPCVEVAGAHPFLTDTPDNLMKKGHFNKVPVILGCTSNEGSLMSIFDIMNRNHLEILKKNPEILVPSSFGLKNESYEKKEAGQMIWDFYFKEKNLPFEQQMKNLEMFAGDIFLNIGMEKTRKHLLEMNPFPVYSYFFTNHTRCFCNGLKNYKTENTNRIVGPALEGACHGADLSFLTVVKELPHIEITSKCREAIKKYNKAWSRFASVGDPNCEELKVIWEKDSINNPCFMDIGTSWEMKMGIPFKERVDFWNEIAAKYNNS